MELQGVNLSGKACSKMPNMQDGYMHCKANYAKKVLCFIQLFTEITDRYLFYITACMAVSQSAYLFWGREWEIQCYVMSCGRNYVKYGVLWSLDAKWYLTNF